MTQATIATRAPLTTVTAVDTAEDTVSGVSWAAVLAGAFVAAAFSLALVALGAGIGLVSVSPWSSNNPSVTTFTVLAAAWFIAVQLFATGVGGYIAGRLRTRWARVHTDEVFFRDTAHGLLVWAVGAVIAAALLASAASSAVSGAARLASSATEAVGSATGQAAGQAVRRWAIRRAISPICFGAAINPLRAIRPQRLPKAAGSCRALCTTAIFPPAIRPISLNSLRAERD